MNLNDFVHGSKPEVYRCCSQTLQAMGTAVSSWSSCSFKAVVGVKNYTRPTVSFKI